MSANSPLSAGKRTRPARLRRAKRTQISELIKRGEFPRPIKLSDGGRAKAWLEDELLLWQRQRLASRDAAWKGANRE